ncbi:BON domain-containing protein [Thermopolyspora sp. NPDC052614]|uniref:BON domain-containing protein n=1 Tax=Thermopolyspora sp. NPDC052614 TaxID=3155682 RepID=UPI00341CC57A
MPKQAHQERTQDAPHYVAARVQQALAEDERTNELGIKVDVHGDQVFLRGRVGSVERRRHLTEVAKEAAPGAHVHNEVDVVNIRAAEEDERL